MVSQLSSTTEQRSATKHVTVHNSLWTAIVFYIEIVDHWWENPSCSIIPNAIWCAGADDMHITIHIIELHLCGRKTVRFVACASIDVIITAKLLVITYVSYTYGSYMVYSVCLIFFWIKPHIEKGEVARIKLMRYWLSRLIYTWGRLKCTYFSNCDRSQFSNMAADC